MNKQHAEHNEKACDFLLTSSDFYDWVITTAFYSALHHVQHEIFPFTDGGVTYNNIDQYKIRIRSELSKHKLTIQLVEKNLPKVKAYYRWLYDSCMTARYKHYVTSEAYTEQAKLCLKEIKKALKKVS